ncbi:MAG: DUF1573 domain-containing protein [Bacteroidales bacterium]
MNKPGPIAIALCLILAICFSIPVIAQKSPVFKITSFRHNFGVIQAGDGSVSHVFQVENPGGDSLRMIKIKSSAENVTGEFSPPVLAPGAKGEITLTYNPVNDQGKVEKFVSIRTNDPQNPIRQFGVLAEVIPVKKTKADSFPVKMGNLRLAKRHIVMDKLLNTESRTDTLRIYNDWNKSMTLQVASSSGHLDLQILPAALEPKSEGMIIVTYNATKSGIYGPELEYFHLRTNDSIETNKAISVGVNVVEDFTYLKDSPGKKAKVRFQSTQHDFGQLREGAVVEYSYVLENIGKGDLIIRRTKASCGCTVAKLEKEILKSGEKSSVTVKFDSRGMSGSLMKTLTVVCNDPDNPVTMLNFSAVVVK